MFLAHTEDKISKPKLTTPMVDFSFFSDQNNLFKLNLNHCCLLDNMSRPAGKGFLPNPGKIWSILFGQNLTQSLLFIGISLLALSEVFSHKIRQWMKLWVFIGYCSNKANPWNVVKLSPQSHVTSCSPFLTVS